MLKRTTGLILAGILTTGAVGAVAMTPASATTSDNVVTSRLAGLKSALSGLVSDGTLTQAQADKMKSRLTERITDRVNDARPARGPGHGPRGSEKAPAGSTSGGMMGTPLSTT